MADPLLKRLRDVASVVVPEALDLCTEVLPDALVSDLGMPGRDGHSLIREVRNTLHEAAPRLAVALSAYASPPDRERAIAAGFNHHIAKPIAPDLLVQAVHRMLNGRPAAAS